MLAPAVGTSKKFTHKKTALCPSQGRWQVSLQRKSKKVVKKDLELLTKSNKTRSTQLLTQWRNDVKLRETLRIVSDVYLIVDFSFFSAETSNSPRDILSCCLRVREGDNLILSSSELVKVSTTEWRILCQFKISSTSTLLHSLLSFVFRLQYRSLPG